MYLEYYARLLGRLYSNIQSLEFLLRAFLYAKADPPHSPLASGMSLQSLQVGNIVPENALTDYSSLGRLIDRYNCLIAPTCPELAVDRSIVDLRDALAHGRVSATDPNEDLVLLKFDKPSNSATIVTYSQKLTVQWLNEQVNHTLAEMQKVARASGNFADLIWQNSRPVSCPDG